MGINPHCGYYKQESIERKVILFSNSISKHPIIVHKCYYPNNPQNKTITISCDVENDFFPYNPTRHDYLFAFCVLTTLLP